MNSTELFDDLAQLGARLARTTPPVTADEIVRAVVGTEGASSESGNETTIVPLAPRRRATVTRRRVVVLTLAAAVLVAIVATVTIARRDTSAPPASPPSVLVPSPDPARIDSFPFLDDADLPTALRKVGIGGTFSQATEDGGWGGFVGVPAPDDGLPTKLTTIVAWPPGWQWPGGPEVALEGRRPDVTELRWTGSRIMTLQWSVGDRYVTVTGDSGDVDVLYELLDHVELVNDGGYVLRAPLPAGLTELVPPLPSGPMVMPGLGDGDDSGTFNLSVLPQSPFNVLIGDDTDAKPVTINGHQGIVATRGEYTDIAFPIWTDESVYLSSRVLSRDELIAVARKVRFTDRQTWIDRYQMAVFDHPEMMIPTTTQP
ncbi:MAG: hypothetical protein QM733_06035 [Ilumatobacteraceae bacterium]